MDGLQVVPHVASRLVGELPAQGAREIPGGGVSVYVPIQVSVHVGS